MLISLSLMRKACFRVRYRAVPEACYGTGGGAATAWRLNEKTRRRAASGKDEQNSPQIFGRAPLAQRRVAFVRSPSRKIVSASSRRVRAPAKYPTGPSGAQAKPNTSRPRPRTVDARRRSVYEEAIAIRNGGSQKTPWAAARQKTQQMCRPSNWSPNWSSKRCSPRPCEQDYWTGAPPPRRDDAWKREKST